MNLQIRTLIIDSSQRNTIIYPSNNSWVYQLKDYKQIEQINLIGAIIANSQYIINPNNFVLTVNNGGTDYYFSITNGNYTPTSLASELQTRLNTNLFASVFTVNASTVTSKFTFTSTLPVIYKFGLNLSLGRVCGFNANTASTTSVVSTNNYQVNSTRYYKVIIDEINNTVDTNILPTNFTFLIPNNCNTGEFNYLNNLNNVNNKISVKQREFPSRFTFKIFDEDNFLVLLNGIEYIFTLEITFG